MLAVGSRVHFLTQPVEEADQLKAAIQSIQPSDEHSSYGELARALRTIAQSSRIPLEVHFVSDMQKSSLPPAFADLRLGGDTKLVFHSVADSKEPNWMVESVTAPAKIYDPKKVRVQAVIAGVGHRRPPARTRLAGAGWQSARKQVRGHSRQRPRLGRIRVARFAARLPQRRNSHRARRFAARRRPFRFRRRTHRSAPGAVSASGRTGARRVVLSLRARIGLRSRLRLWNRWLWSRPRNQSLSKYAFVVLSDVGAHAARPGKQPARLRHRRRLAVGRAGPRLGRAQRVPVSNEAIQGSSYAGRERLALSNRRLRRCRASRACAAPTSWMASSSIR